jgi:anti-sigma B factor antagonist
MSYFPTPKRFSVRTEQRGATAVVVPSGELDIDTARALEQGLDRAFDSGSDRVVLDLRELEFLDSSGLRSLLLARRRAEDARKPFALVAGSHELERTLEIAGVHSIFDWTPAEELG